MGVDEDFDDERHAKQRQRDKSACKSDDEKRWEAKFGENGDVGHHGRIDERQFVLFAEQLKRIVADLPTVNLGLTGSPKYSGGKQPCRQRDD